MEEEELIILDTYDPYNDEELADMYDDFFGKKARARRKARREARREHKLAKITARGDARATVAKAGGGMKGLGAGISGLVGSIFGGGAEPAPAPAPGGIMPDPGTPPPSPQNEDGMKKFIIIGAVALLVVGGIVLYVRSRKNA